MKQRVLITTNVPSPYRIDFFNELSKHVDLTVIFEKSKSDERDTRWKAKEDYNFKSIFLNGFKVTTDTAFSFEIISYLINHRKSKILILNPLTPTGIFSIAILRLLKIEFMVETDGAYFIPDQHFSNFIRSFSYKKAKFVFSTSKTHDDYYIKLGVSKDKILRYPFTSIRESEIISKLLTIDQKVQLKRQLNVSEKYMILSVGQFIHRKGFDVLIKASQNFNDDVGFYFIGGKNTEIYNDLLSNINKNNIHFLDFMIIDDLRNYYQAADLFVLPTREDIWGLVVNEAMANGLPIITSDKCLAGTELVENNVNGYLFKSEDSVELTIRINEIIENNLFNEYSIQSLNKIHNFTIENMVNSHLEKLI